MSKKEIELPNGETIVERRGGFKLTIETGIAIAAALITLGGLVVYAQRVPALEDKVSTCYTQMASISQEVKDIRDTQTRMLDLMERRLGK